METTQIICRLCLTQKSQQFCPIDETAKDILEIILPDVNIQNYSLSLCQDCYALLQEFFKFKSTCLEIEDTIHNYTCEGQVQVDLEKIIGLKDIDSEKKGKICRMCLEFTENDSCSELDDKKHSLLVQMQRKCLPEMDLQLTKGPVICDKCEKMLRICFNFFSHSMDNDEKITEYQKTKEIHFEDFHKVLHAVSTSTILIPEIMVPFPKSHSEDATLTLTENSFSQTHSIQGIETLSTEEKEKMILSSSDDNESLSSRKSSRVSMNVHTNTEKRKRKSLVKLLGDLEADSTDDDPDFRPESESEDFSDFEESLPRKKISKTLNNHEAFSCNKCRSRFSNASDLGQHIVQCGTLQETNISEKVNSENIDKNCNERENKVKETDLLKDLQKIHDSIRELGKMKKNKKKKQQKSKKNVEKADLLHHTELTMKVKVIVNPSVQTSTKLAGTENDEVSSIPHPGFNKADKSPEKDLSELEIPSTGEIISGSTEKLEESHHYYTFSPNHRQLTILKCDSCDYNTRSFQKIEQHVLIHLNRLKDCNKLFCPHCPEHFENTVQMYQHSKNKHSRCNYRLYHWCVNCSTIFSSEKVVSEHFNSCPRKNYVCKLFRSNRNMFCMLCKYESDDEKEAKAHRNSCQFKKLTVVGDTIQID